MNKQFLQQLRVAVQLRPINPWLMILVLCLYLINNCILKIHSAGALHIFLCSHFNDLLCPLFLLSYANLLLLTVGREIRQLRWMMLICLVASFVWEWGAPLIKPHAVADPVDVVCYLLGSMIYWAIYHCAAQT